MNGEDEVDVEFIEFRREAGDCIEYIYAVVGSSVLDILALGLAGMLLYYYLSHPFLLPSFAANTE